LLRLMMKLSVVISSYSKNAHPHSTMLNAKNLHVPRLAVYVTQNVRVDCFTICRLFSCTPALLLVHVVGHFDQTAMINDLDLMILCDWIIVL